MPIHIVHGIKDPTGDPTNLVTVSITLPSLSAFTVTSVELWTFLGGSSTGTKSGTPPAASSLGNFPIGKLAANDKVIVVIEGYFTQAGSYSIPFTAERLTSTPSVTEGPPTEPSVLNIPVQNITPPVDVSVTKVVKDSTGAFNSTATWPFGTTVSYKITVKNASAPAADGSTDLYLANLLTLTDTITAPNSNGVAIDITPTYYPCTSSSTRAACVTQPSPSSLITWFHGSFNLFTISYPAGSPYGLLPAQDSFEIKFDLLLGTKELCYHASQTNQLDNTARITYSSNTISDQVATNNNSTATVTLTGGPSTPCPPPISITGTKKITNPTTPPNALPWGLFDYTITFTTPSTPLTSLTLSDYVYGTGVPPFTATFLASSVTCLPTSACPPLSITPTTAAPLVGSYNTGLFGINFASVPPNTPVTITYQVKYDAPCAEVATNGTITNTAYLGGATSGTVSVNVSGAFSVTANMDTLPICPLQVSKTQTPVVPSFGSYPQTLKYHVEFKNPSTTQTVTFGTVLDTIALDSAQYGKVPITYSFSSCTGSNVSPVPPASGGPFSSFVTYQPSVGSGLPLLNFAGTTFQGGGSIACDVSVTLNQPPTDDSLCQGAGSPHIINAAFVNLLPNNRNKPSQASWYQDVTTQLPYCVSIAVDKTTPSTAVPGGPISFTLAVTNTGNDPLSNIVLQDILPVWASALTWNWSCTSGPCTGSGNGSLSVTIAPSPQTLAAHASATVTITGTAPDALGSFCNKDHAEIQPFPALTYFEGVDDLKNGSACIDVKSPVGITPTPTPNITPTPAPTGCAQISGQPVCLPNGGYGYTFNVANNSGSDMSQILLTPLPGSTFTLTPQLTHLSSPLQNGQSTTVTTQIGNAKPGDKVCFFASLMADQTACCTVQVCTTLPKCDATTTSPTPTATPRPMPTPTPTPTTTSPTPASPTPTSPSPPPVKRRR